MVSFLPQVVYLPVYLITKAKWSFRLNQANLTQEFVVIDIRLVYPENGGIF